MIVDLKKIKLRETILDGALWVVEQIPSLVQSGDQTDVLRAGTHYLHSVLYTIAPDVKESVL